MDREVCTYEHSNSECTEIVGTYDYYNGGNTSNDQNDLLTVNVKASSGCQESKGWDDCSIQTQGGYCRTCNFDDTTKMLSFSDCDNIPGVFARGIQSIFLGDSAEYFRLTAREDDEMYQQPDGAVVPMLAPRSSEGTSGSPGGDTAANLRGSSVSISDQTVVAIAEHFVFSFVPGHVDSEPDAGSIAILMERTAQFFRDFYRSKYSDSFHSLQIGNVETEYSAADGKFHLDLEAEINFAASSTISNRLVASLISKHQTLNNYVAAVRYSGVHGRPNGPLYHTSVVQARIVGSESS
jgi:hypothetical protein